MQSSRFVERDDGRMEVWSVIVDGGVYHCSVWSLTDPETKAIFVDKIPTKDAVPRLPDFHETFASIDEAREWFDGPDGHRRQSADQLFSRIDPVRFPPLPFGAL